MIGIHYSQYSFSERWISYCVLKNIDYKIVDCYNSDIINQLKDCDALMWHHDHMHSKDVLFAKQLLFSLEVAGKVVFPDFKTNWHFDDKLGQKYLLESLNFPTINTYVSFDKTEALAWSKKTTFPKVFKLRSGGGSWNVFFVKDRNSARSLIRKAFTIGFSQYDSWSNIRERWQKLMYSDGTVKSLLMGFVRIGYHPGYSKVKGKEKGYVYFQDFIPDNDSDIRVIVIDKKAFAIKRMVRKNDFRASGSGNIYYEKKLFDENTIKLAFEIAEKIGGQSVAMDFVYDNGKPKVVEVSYGFVSAGYEDCPGYWDRDMNWYESKFDPCEWMVDFVVDKIKERSLSKLSVI